MKKLLRIILIFIAITCFPATAFMSWGPSYNGEPAMLNPTHIRGTFVWHDQNGFHLRTTTNGEHHVFSGTVHSNGSFKDINDRFFKDKDYYHFKDRDTIDFQFTTDGRTVGIDFNVADGDYIAFELYMDGNKINPMDIYVGKDGWHPGDYKFTVDRAPDHSYNNDEHSVVIINDGWYDGWYGGGYYGYNYTYGGRHVGGYDGGGHDGGHDRGHDGGGGGGGHHR